MSNTKNTGGPFTAMEYTPGNYVQRHSDMDLRDHFAGLAMQGILSNTWIDYDDLPTISSRAYAWADAMLKAPER